MAVMKSGGPLAEPEVRQAAQRRKSRSEPRKSEAAAPFPEIHSPAFRDSYSATALADIIDRSAHAAFARFSAGLSPASLIGAYFDWAAHLAFSPGKQMQLADKAMRKSLRLAEYMARCAQGRAENSCCIEPLPQDKRFAGEEWQKLPFNFFYQSFLLQQQWWHNATTGIGGVSKPHEAMLEFGARQILDVFSPSNFIATNPELIEETIATGGQNLITGLQNFIEDWERAASGKKPIGAEAFEIGREVAATPGKVVYRNHLIELIQYAPVGETVHPEPILIVPAWIMKYYILDLSPANSLVKYLTEQGYTVFMISWKNPDAADRDLGLDDYRTLGPMAALEVVNAIVPQKKVHAVGYCIGGTLLSIVAAAMARDNDDRLQSVTLFAAQTDFREAGELMLFIDESQLHFLEDMMWEQGFLDTKQMAGAFQMLRSNDLIWSHMIRNYLMGDRRAMIDLMAWNADATRMPYRMHTEYLNSLFLKNDFAEGRYLVDGRPIALTDIRAPIFAVGALKDHVAPWRSTYKIQLLADTDVTYLLTSGGHNAGIVSEPGHANRSYQCLTKPHDARYVDPETWLATAPLVNGSWWPEWVTWLNARSGAPVAPPALGTKDYPALMDAPGSYVLQD